MGERLSRLLPHLLGARLLYSDLKTDILNRCDMASSGFISDPEMLSYLNASAAELHEILVESYAEDYAVSEYFVSSPAGAESFPLPSDFFKLLALDALIGDGYTALKRHELADRNRFAPVSLIPAYVYRLTYAPRYQDATSLSQSLPDNFALQRWSEFIVTDVAIKVLTKQETDASVFMAQRQALQNRIIKASSNRDAGEPFELTGSRGHGPYCQCGCANYSAAPLVRYRLSGSNIKLAPLSVFGALR